jgi:hypothetical protein
MTAARQAAPPLAAPFSSQRLEKPQCRDDGAPSRPPSSDPSPPDDDGLLPADDPGVVPLPVGVPLGAFGLVAVDPWVAVDEDPADVAPPVGVPAGVPAVLPPSVVPDPVPEDPGLPQTTLSCAA